MKFDLKKDRLKTDLSLTKVLFKKNEYFILYLPRK